MPPFGGDTNNYISPRNGRSSGKPELRFFFASSTTRTHERSSEWID